MPINTLNIIGNGFDLYHNIKSSYPDFRLFIETKNPSLLSDIEQYISPEILWSDFETALAHVDVDLLIDNASDFLVSYSAEDWSDSYHHDYQYEIEQIVSKISFDLYREFDAWVHQLKIPKESELSVKLLNISKENKYLSFNYTNALSTLYGISESNILYIHGSVDTGSDMVLGHGWSPEDRDSLNKHVHLDPESYDTRVTEGNDIIDGYFSKTYKPTEQVIKENIHFFAGLNNIKEINILGHSLSEIDMEYFKELIKHIDLKIVKWNISYFSDSSKEERINIITNLGVSRSLCCAKKFDEF